ncbi:MAG: YdcF family protein [Clostridia bacterium]|nr:YdcF family protein [Clostridia bacterium]
MKVFKNISRFAVICGSVFMVIWYVISRIITIGSVFGVIVFSAIGTAAVFYDRIKTFLKRIRKNKALRIITDVAAGLICLAVIYTVTVLCMMKYYSSRKPSENATVVVLGCQVNGETPSLMLRKRLEAAYEYLEAHPDAKCIVSGGKGNYEDISEAECMYRWLTDKGISASRIYREDKSVNTDENIVFSGKIIKAEGLDSELAIVTDGFHELRASVIAKRNGFSCGAVPAKTPFYLAANFTTREVLAVTADMIFH